MQFNTLLSLELTGHYPYLPDVWKWHVLMPDRVALFAHTLTITLYAFGKAKSAVKPQMVVEELVVSLERQNSIEFTNDLVKSVEQLRRMGFNTNEAGGKWSLASFRQSGVVKKLSQV